MGLGTTELLIVLVIVLVLFGGSRIPELMGGLGKGLRAFKRASNGQDEIDLSPKERGLDAKAKERIESDVPEEVGSRRQSGDR